MLIQQFLYPVTDAPRYLKGFPASLGFVGGMCAWVFLVRGFEIWDSETKIENREIGLVVDVERSSDEMRDSNGLDLNLAAMNKMSPIVPDISRPFKGLER